MNHAKVSKLMLDDYGSYLGMEEGCFTVKDKNGATKRYPMFENEIGEVILKSGNCVSTGALASLGFWGIDTLIMTQKGKPVAMLKSLDDDSHVKTRVCQYEALNNEKGVHIAKQLVLGKFEGQNQVLKKYGLRRHDFSIQEKVKNLEDEDTARLRTRLMAVEGHFSDNYFTRIFSLIPTSLRPQSRKTFKAYDGMNNLFNLAYEMLSWKVHRALINAKLEPYLGFLHSMAEGKPSLVCDFMELYRYLIDGFIIQHCRKLQKRDFMMKNEDFSTNRKGKREYLNNSLTRNLVRNLNEYFKTKVEIQRIRMGKKQEIETLINEEAMLLGMYLRSESKDWIPRIGITQ
jgi:CRISPR-associated protein Cas1